MVIGNQSSKRSIAELHAWWEHQRGSRPMPCRSELDPAALRRALPDLLIIDVAPGADPGAHLFTYRLTGTRIDNRLGFSLKGRTVDMAQFGDATATIREQYETAVAERRPLLCTHTLLVGGARHIEYDRLVVPLSNEDGTDVVALVAAVNFICAYAVAQGKPKFCPDPAACDRKDLCVPAYGAPPRQAADGNDSLR
jgi:hypothetical protein